jgi:hypothetical protein
VGFVLMLGDDVAAELPRFRAQAESLMVDTVTVERPDGTTIDPDTLAEVVAFVEVYAGKARIQRPGALSPQDIVAGGYEFDERSVLAQLPLTATGIASADRLTVTAVGPLTDPDLDGLVATVQANLTKTHPTKRTLVCEEVS